MKKKFQEERRSPEPLKRNRDHRTHAERDLARLIHSAAFRRLQAKTQVLGVGEGDFHRTRLTHSMEVAQIGKGIVRNLLSRKDDDDNLERILPDPDLIFGIGLAHDLGHPPFGHGGEVALNYCMRRVGGFEGNGQTLRILSKIEAHTEGYGLDLTRRMLLGVLKYPVKYSKLIKTDLPVVNNRSMIKADQWKPPKCYYDDEADIVNWILKPLSGKDKKKFIKYIPPKKDKNGKPKEKALDTTIMELADDISYGVHDLEDAIVLKLITREMWREASGKINITWAKDNRIVAIEKKLFGSSHERKIAIGSLVHAFMISTGWHNNYDFNDPLLAHRLGLSNEAQEAIKILKKLVVDNVIKIPEVQTLEYRGQQIVLQLFEVLASDPKRFLKTNFKEQWERADSEQMKMRCICDYISGMTDEYATRLYERFFLPRHGTVFQKL